MPASLSPRKLTALVSALRNANRTFAREYPGDAIGRQPVHTFIIGGDVFTSDAAQRAGAQAIAALDTYGSTAKSFAAAIDLPSIDAAFAERVRVRVLEKLEREPVEDCRLDFEDGYGTRPDAEEDGHAESAARQVAAGMKAATLPPFIGIRIKPMSAELHARSLRTLDIFVTTLVKSAKRLPDNFAVTLTKVMTPAHVTIVAEMCTALERTLGLKAGAIRLELMIETPQSLLAPDGTVALRSLVDAGDRRVRSAHLGVYDYTALCGITAAHQHLRHPACDFARHLMQVALAQTGVTLCDGSSNLLPIAPHVHAAWKTHFADVRHSLKNGYYQGWDLHAAQLPTRYAAVYAFYLSALPAATLRLKRFFDKATKAGAAFDDAATGQALVNFFARALSSGAITLEEARQTGLSESDLQSGSFRKILARRSA
jgi:citrate lyase beta subunit